jgi:hypothetical protein
LSYHHHHHDDEDISSSFPPSTAESASITLSASSSPNNDDDPLEAFDQACDIVMSSILDQEFFEQPDSSLSSSFRSPTISDPSPPQVRGTIRSPDFKTATRMPIQEEQYRRDLLLDDQRMFQERLSKYRDEEDTKRRRRRSRQTKGSGHAA